VPHEYFCLTATLTECAWAAAAKKNCFLKDKFWRITTKSGGKKSPAVVAIAHTLLILVYQALLTGQAYQDNGAPVLDQRQRQRMIRHHIRRLGKLGIAVDSPRSGTSAPAASPTAGD
jgi:hypothetical protein